jgi:hypothetical protein
MGAKLWLPRETAPQHSASAYLQHLGVESANYEMAAAQCTGLLGARSWGAAQLSYRFETSVSAEWFFPRAVSAPAFFPSRWTGDWVAACVGTSV